VAGGWWGDGGGGGGARRVEGRLAGAAVDRGGLGLGGGGERGLTPLPHLRGTISPIPSGISPFFSSYRFFFFIPNPPHVLRPSGHWLSLPYHPFGPFVIVAGRAESRILRFRIRIRSGSRAMSGMGAMPGRDTSQ